MENISVIIKEPGKKAYAKEIPNTLESLKEIVGGHIESVTVSSDMVIICNEEGLYLNLPYNCSFCNIDFVGTIIFCGFHGEEFVDVPIWIDKLECISPNLFEGDDVESHYEDPDAHSCRAEADSSGYCQVCGAIVHGSLADYEEHGYDPPGTY